MPIDYKKWDSLELDDSSDDEKPPPPSGQFVGDEPAPAPKFDSSSGKLVGDASREKRSATVTAGFIVRTTSRDGGKPVYINVCGSTSVPGGMRQSGQISSAGFDATVQYICADLRADEDERGACYVVECLFHPDVMARCTRADEKATQEGVIRTALGVVSGKQLALNVDEWSLFEPAALRETSGAYFFAPAKLKPGGTDGGSASDAAEAADAQE